MKGGGEEGVACTSECQKCQYVLRSVGEVAAFCAPRGREPGYRSVAESPNRVLKRCLRHEMPFYNGRQHGVVQSARRFVLKACGGKRLMKV